MNTNIMDGLPSLDEALGMEEGQGASDTAQIKQEAANAPLDNENYQLPSLDEALAMGQEQTASPIAEQPKDEGSILASAGAGAKEAILPFSMSADERAEALKGGKANLAAYIVSNLATGIATGAAIGSAVPVLGTAIGATAGAVAKAAMIAPALYAVYAGLGRDRLRAQEEHEEWNPLSGQGIATAALTIGTELNPLVKASSKTAAMVRAGAQITGEMAIEKLHGGDDKAVAMAGVFGLLGAASVARNVAGRGPIAEKVTQDVFENLTDIDKSLKDNSMGWFSKATNALSKEDLSMPAEVSSEFKRYVVGDIEANLSAKKLDDAFKAASTKLQPEKLQDMYVLHKTEEVLSKTVARETAELNKDISSAPKIQDINKAEEWLNPMLFVARKVDNVTGLETSRMVDKFVQAGHAFNNVSYKFSKDQSKFRKEGSKLGLDGRDVFELATGGNSPNLSAARKKYGDAVLNEYKGRIEKHTDEMLGYLTEMGYNPLRRKNYMPLKAKKPTDLAIEVEGMASELKTFMKSEGLSSLDAVREAKKGDAFETLSLLDQLSQKRLGGPITEGADLAKLKNAILTKTGMKDVDELDSDLSALFSRKGELSDRLQQKNAWELLSGYVNENMRAAHFEDAMKYGQMYVRTLETAGMKRASEMYGRYIKDQMGNSWGLNGAIKGFMTQMEYQGTKLARDTTASFGSRKAGEVLKAMPEFTSWMNNQIYPAKLGLNVPGMLRNMTQFMSNTVPEIGGSYGSKIALRGGLATVKDMKAGSLKQKLKDKNLISDFFVGEKSEIPTAMGGIKEKVNEFNEKLMTAYSATDTMNRSITYNMGHEIAKDVLKGDKDALKFMASTDPTLKAQIRRAMLKGSGKSVEENVGDVIGRYLVSKTQFNYGKAAQAQWVRGVGPLFGMFSTWPNMVGADVINILREKKIGQGSKEVAQKYLAPYALAVGLSKMLENTDNPHVQYLVGKPENWVPFDAVAPKAGEKGRGFLSNPLIDFAAQTAGAGASVAQGDIKTPVKKILQTGVTSYLPIVSPILNEADKISRIYRGEKITTKALNKMGLEGE